MEELEELIDKYPFKGMQIVLEMEKICVDMKALTSQQDLLPSYWNKEKNRLLNTYRDYIPNEKVLVKLYTQINN